RMRRMSLRDRLMRFAERPDECWIWPGALNRKGYGLVTMRAENSRGYRTRIAHRAAYEMIIGPVPPDLELDHVVCHRRACVNPFHMEPVAHRVNVLRSDQTLSGRFA